MHLSLLDNSTDNFVMVSMLQHIDNPIKAMEEVHRTLKIDGYLILINAFTRPSCDVKDYWRFSEDTYKFLLKDNFEILKLYKLGGKYSAFANTFQRPRKSNSIRPLLIRYLVFLLRFPVCF